jgi:hypothetical protein
MRKDQIPNSNTPNYESRTDLNFYVNSWNFIIGRKPDQFTFSSVLKACVSIETMEQGSIIHASIIKIGFESATFVGSALVYVYSKCGRIEDA